MGWAVIRMEVLVLRGREREGGQRRDEEEGERRREKQEDERLDCSFCRIDFEPAYPSFRVKDLTVEVGEFDGVVVDDADVTFERAKEEDESEGELELDKDQESKGMQKPTDSSSSEILYHRTS